MANELIRGFADKLFKPMADGDEPEDDDAGFATTPDELLCDGDEPEDDDAKSRRHGSLTLLACSATDEAVVPEKAAQLLALCQRVPTRVPT